MHSAMLLDSLWVLLTRLVMRAGRAVGQAGLTFGEEASTPFAHGLGIDVECRRHGQDGPPFSQALDHRPSTARRVLGILVKVHPAAPGWGCVRGSHNLPARPRMDNLHSNDS